MRTLVLAREYPHQFARIVVGVAALEVLGLADGETVVARRAHLFVDAAGPHVVEHEVPCRRCLVPARIAVDDERALAVRTVFNVLGPLTNPAAPPYQLIGAYSKEAAKLMADTLAGMPLERAFVVHGEPGWDEATPAGDFVLYDVRPGSVDEQVRSPGDYGLAVCKPEDLEGGDAEYNAREMVRVFTGEDRGAHRDALLMGVSLVLECLGTAEDARDGVAQAAAAIDDGRAAAFLDTLRTHFEGR